MTPIQQMATQEWTASNARPLPQGKESQDDKAPSAWQREMERAQMDQWFQPALPFAQALTPLVSASTSRVSAVFHAPMPQTAHPYGQGPAHHAAEPDTSRLTSVDGTSSHAPTVRKAEPESTDSSVATENTPAPTPVTATATDPRASAREANAEADAGAMQTRARQFARSPDVPNTASQLSANAALPGSTGNTTSHVAEQLAQPSPIIARSTSSATAAQTTATVILSQVALSAQALPASTPTQAVLQAVQTAWTSTMEAEVPVAPSARPTIPSRASEGPAIRVHMEPDGTSVAVWIGMHEDDAMRGTRLPLLLSELRRSLGDQGGKLGALTLNGRPVWRDASGKLYDNNQTEG